MSDTAPATATQTATVLTHYRALSQAAIDCDDVVSVAPAMAAALTELDQLRRNLDPADELASDVDKALQNAPPSVQAERGRMLLEDLAANPPTNGSIADTLEDHDALQWLAHLIHRDPTGFDAATFRLNDVGFQVRQTNALATAARKKAANFEPLLAPETRPHPKQGLGPDDLGLDDKGNARRLVRDHGRDLKYVPGIDWHHYDGRRWALDQYGEVKRAAKKVTDGLLDLAKATNDLDARKLVLACAHQSSYRPRLDSIVNLAETEPDAWRPPDEFDTDPLTLNVANGTVDLRTGDLRAHRREDWLTKIANAAYDPDAACPQFKAFLELIFDGRDDLIAYVQRLVGYGITGDQGEQCFVILNGEGENGKSTLIGVLLGLLGEYATAAAADTYMQVQRGNIRNDLARLRGLRFVASTEPPKGARLDVALVKEITGGDPIVARFLYREVFTFIPQFKPWVSCNTLPSVDEDTHAIWRRLRVVPFDVKVPDRVSEVRRHYARHLLQHEAAGILAWAVRGCLDWQAHGLGEPQAVTDATAGYRAEQTDPATIPAFITHCCTNTDTDAFTPSEDLLDAYKRWAAEESLRPIVTDLSPFVKELGRLNYKTERKSHDGAKKRGIVGLTLKPEWTR